MLCLWAISGIVQFALLFLVFAKRHYRKVPLFAVYITLNLSQACFLVLVYSHFGFGSLITRDIYWISEPIVLVTQALAATELLHRVLRYYPGIWGLAWRVIAVAAVVIASYASASVGRDPHWRLMIANRGYHLTFAVAMISALLLVRIYSIPANPTYRVLLAGFCFASCEVVVADTLYQTLVLRNFPRAGDVWNYVEMSVFIGVRAVWAVALRHPIPADEERPSLLPKSDYGRLSPDINSGLRRINDVLDRFLRMEAPRS
jgi:hypothetical protein